jgi:uncharacterized protein
MNPQRTRRSILSALAILALPALVAACGGADGAAGEPQTASSRDTTSMPPRGSAWVIFDADTVVAEVADTPALRERGLMFRTEVPDGTGMLFVFEDSQVRSFWMRNTYVPLDIAFMDPAMRVVDIRQMEPESEELTESAAPAMFALEVRQGWFEQQGIETGAQARIVFGRR